jgi:hypothetical protein
MFIEIWRLENFLNFKSNTFYINSIIFEKVFMNSKLAVGLKAIFSKLSKKLDKFFDIYFESTLYLE